MADKVGVKETEYTELLDAIKKAHEDSLEQMENAISQIRTLNTRGGGIYIEHLTPKINMLIRELYSIKKSIAEVYEAHEEIVVSFEQTIDNLDKE